jgi:hypothetical protein
MDNKFLNLTTTQLGTTAESMLIAEFAKSKGYFPYTPEIQASHPIDCLMLSGSSIWMMDLKCKSRRKYFADTGCDTLDVEKYINYPFPVYILWADIVQKKIYGNWLVKLYPHKKVENNITYFPLDMMVKYRDMTDDEYEELKKLERSKYY